MRKVTKTVVKLAEGNYKGILKYKKETSPIVEQENFATHEEAMDWLLDEMESRQLSYDVMSFYNLIGMVDKNPRNNEAKRALFEKIEWFRMELFNIFIDIDGLTEDESEQKINTIFGESLDDVVVKCRDKTLDALLDVQYERFATDNFNIFEGYDLEEADIIKANAHQGSEAAIEVLRVVSSIPGKKVITVQLTESYQFDINESGEVGNGNADRNALLEKFDRGFGERNSFFVRQTIPGSEFLETVDGKSVSNHWKALSAFILYDDGIIAISADDVEYAFSHDPNDNPIPVEDYVIYKDFNEFFPSSVNRDD